jgi:hypothetical protein
MVLLLCDVSIDLDPIGGVVLQKPAGGSERPPVCGQFPQRRIFVEIMDDPARFQMNEEEHVIGGETSPGEHLDDKEIGTCQVGRDAGPVG